MAEEWGAGDLPPEDQARLGLIAVADDVEKEMAGSTTVRLLLTRAAEEADAAMAAMLTVDPADVEAIRRHQNDYRRHADLRRWIAEAIQAGRESEAAFLGPEQ